MLLCFRVLLLGLFALDILRPHTVHGSIIPMLITTHILFLRSRPAFDRLMIYLCFTFYTAAMTYIYLGITLGEYIGLWSRKESMQELDCFAALGASTNLGSDDLGTSAPATNDVEPALDETKRNKASISLQQQQQQAPLSAHREDGPFSDADDNSTTITAPSSKAHSLNLEPIQDAQKTAATENNQKQNKEPFEKKREPEPETSQEPEPEPKPESVTHGNGTAPKPSSLLAMVNKNVPPSNQQQLMVPKASNVNSTPSTECKSITPQPAPHPKKSRSLSSFFRQRRPPQVYDGGANRESIDRQAHGNSKPRVGLTPSVSVQIQRKPSISSRMQTRIKNSSKRVSSLFQKW